MTEKFSSGRAGPWDPATGPELTRQMTESLMHLDGPLLPVLHAVQAAFGYIDDGAVPVIAETLNLTRADVHGVISFYHDFRRRPAPARQVQICRAEACQSMGATRLFDEVTAACAGDEDIEVREVFCLGNCALSPAALIDGTLYGRLDTEGTLKKVRA
ncbi:MAG: NAD(P)H-dependent oxidoreductase subunit E [Alphaproteobacteria bacterium]|jgi:formate dehydrogenase subunit gamma